MSETLRRTQARLHGMRELQEIIGAIRALSAIRLNQAEDQMPGVLRHGAVVGSALWRALDPPNGAPDGFPGPAVPRALVVLGSDRGFVGAMNRHLVGAAAECDPAAPAIVAGARLARAFEDAGRPALARIPMASHAGGVETAARRLVASVRRAGLPLAGVTLIHPRAAGQGRAEPERTPMWPMPAAPERTRRATVAPLRTLPLPALLAELFEEYVLSRSARAIVETMVAINQTRLVAMQAAHDGIVTRVAALEQAANRLRQEQITDEVIEVAVGADAIRSAEADSARPS